MPRIATTALVVSLVLSGAVEGQNLEVRGDWIVTTEISPMDSVKTVTALRDSAERPSAALVIRCKGKHLEVYVNANEVVSEESGVRIKFDEGKATRQHWERATSYDALFSPDAVDLLRSMKSAKTFYFEFTPYQRAARVVSFDVSKIPESIYAACVTAEIEKADARARKAADDRVKMLAQQKREREESEKRSAALRVKCAPFADGSIEKVERSQFPLPPEECGEVLEWMRNSGNYEDIVKKRELCSLPSFANDPQFCGGSQSKPSGTKTDNSEADQRLINQCKGDPIAQSALKDNCSHKFFLDSHPKACEWVNAQTGK
jgi:hypothetical protein